MGNSFGIGIGNVYTPIFISLGEIKIPAKLSNDHPDFEGPHEPFWITPKELAQNPLYKPYHRFTGAVKH